MHRLRPAQELTLILPVALWIFSHVNGVHGALPTTRKLLFLIFWMCLPALNGLLCVGDRLCLWSRDGSFTVEAARIPGGVFKSQAVETRRGRVAF